MTRVCYNGKYQTRFKNILYGHERDTNTNTETDGGNFLVKAPLPPLIGAAHTDSSGIGALTRVNLLS